MLHQMTISCDLPFVSHSLHSLDHKTHFIMPDFFGDTQERLQQIIEDFETRISEDLSRLPPSKFPLYKIGIITPELSSSPQCNAKMLSLRSQSLPFCPRTTWSPNDKDLISPEDMPRQVRLRAINLALENAHQKWEQSKLITMEKISQYVRNSDYKLWSRAKFLFQLTCLELKKYSKPLHVDLDNKDTNFYKEVRIARDREIAAYKIWLRLHFLESREKFRKNGERLLVASGII